jgi:hypothetical protein
VLAHGFYTRLRQGSQVTLDMRVVVVGGHARNIGKTSVVCGLLSGLKQLGWTAVKISPYTHGTRSVDEHECAGEPDERRFVMTEEENSRGRGDTCRFLAAGARRALWLRVRRGHLAEPFPLLAQALKGDERVMIESNSVLDFLKPSLYLVVLDSHNPDFKASARRLLARADAVVTVGPRFHAGGWREIDAREFDGKPLFSVSAKDYFSRDLCHFVSDHLSSPATLAVPQTRA